MKSNFIKKIKRMLIEGQKYLFEFGFSVFVAIEYCIISDNSIKSLINKDKAILKYLKKNYSYIIEKYNVLKTNENEKNDDHSAPIWVLWWQGFDELPDIISICQISKENNIKGHPIILLHKGNIKQYVDLPDCIWDKFETGMIRIQHLSDIIRIYLIKEYGGLWLDASIFCMQSIPESVFSDTIYSLKKEFNIDEDPYNISCNRWTTFAIGGQKNNTLFMFLYDFFIEYCNKEKMFIDYFLFDCAIAYAYENISSVKTLIDNIPLEKKDYYFLSNHLKNDINEEFLSQLNEKSCYLNKISWNIDTSLFEKDTLFYYLKNGGFSEKS